jgi:hypothetical protein
MDKYVTQHTKSNFKKINMLPRDRHWCALTVSREGAKNLGGILISCSREETLNNLFLPYVFYTVWCLSYSYAHTNNCKNKITFLKKMKERNRKEKYNSK